MPVTQVRFEVNRLAGEVQGLNATMALVLQLLQQSRTAAPPCAPDVPASTTQGSVHAPRCPPCPDCSPTLGSLEDRMTGLLAAVQSLQASYNSGPWEELAWEMVGLYAPPLLSLLLLAGSARCWRSIRLLITGLALFLHPPTTLSWIAWRGSRRVVEFTRASLARISSWLPSWARRSAPAELDLEQAATPPAAVEAGDTEERTGTSCTIS